MKNELIKEMVRFQTDRQLDKIEFDVRIASINIIEELLEAHGVNDTKDRKYSKDIYDYLSHIVGDVAYLEPENFSPPTEHDVVDAFADICEFSVGEPLKLGYDAELVLGEMTKEIHSRSGSIINGKFEKDKSPEAKARWYKANYSLAKSNKELETGSLFDYL